MNTDSTIKILSVDPQKAPVGTLNPELTARFLRRNGVAKSVFQNSNARFAETIFGTESSRRASSLMFCFRLMAGTVLAIGGSLSVIGVNTFQLSVMSGLAFTIIGCMMILGLMNRIIGFAGALGFGLMMIFGLAGNAMAVSAVCFLLFAILGLAGPGRFSYDRILQKKLRDRLTCLGNKKIELDDYRAFSKI